MKQVRFVSDSIQQTSDDNLLYWSTILSAIKSTKGRKTEALFCLPLACTTHTPHVIIGLWIDGLKNRYSYEAIFIPHFYSKEKHMTCTSSFSSISYRRRGLTAGESGRSNQYFMSISLLYLSLKVWNLWGGNKVFYRIPSNPSMHHYRSFRDKSGIQIHLVTTNAKIGPMTTQCQNSYSSQCIMQLPEHIRE